MPLPIPSHAWEYVTADRITSLPKTKHGYTAILVVVDRLTKMTHFMPCKNESTAQVMARLFVDHLWKHHGMPLLPQTEALNSPTSSLRHFVRYWAHYIASPLLITLNLMAKLSA